MAIPRKPMIRARAAGVGATLAMLAATLYVSGLLRPTSNRNWGHDTWSQAISGTWFPGDTEDSEVRTGSGLGASTYTREDSREGATSSGFSSLDDIVLILNYNHPTDAFKSLGFWLRVYRRIFMDVVIVSTEAIPELGIESVRPHLLHVSSLSQDTSKALALARPRLPSRAQYSSLPKSCSSKARQGLDAD